MKTVLTFWELDGMFWSFELVDRFVTFSASDVNQLGERLITRGDIRGRFYLVGRGDNLGAMLEILSSGKIVDVKCDATN